MVWQQMCHPPEHCLWDHASYMCPTVEQRREIEDCGPMPITHSCLQSAYGWHWSFWHASSPVQDPSQVTTMVQPCLDMPLTCASPIPGRSMRETVAYWRKKQCLSKGFAWLWPTVWNKSTSQHPELADHPLTLHHRCPVRRSASPQDPHDHNQMCATTTMDIGHFTLTTGGGAASAQRVCEDGNVGSAMFSCAWLERGNALQYTIKMAKFPMGPYFVCAFRLRDLFHFWICSVQEQKFFWDFTQHRPRMFLTIQLSFKVLEF